MIFNKKGVSTIVVVLLMVALVMVTMFVVFNVTKGTVEEKIEKIESCGVNLIGKISLNPEYVCYDSVNKEIVFSVNRGDLEVDSLLISVETEKEVDLFKIRNLLSLSPNYETISDPNSGESILLTYPERSSQIVFPSLKGGKTYIGININEPPIKIQIAPSVGGKQCEVVDSLTDIVDCSQTTILS